MYHVRLRTTVHFKSNQVEPVKSLGYSRTSKAASAASSGSLGVLYSSNLTKAGLSVAGVNVVTPNPRRAPLKSISNLALCLMRLRGTL